MYVKMAVGCDQTVLCSIVQDQLAHLGEPNIDKFHLLHLIDDYQLFSYEKSPALDKVFKEIHTLLESPKHRWFGLLLLQRAACQCNSDIQSDHAKYWLEKTLSFLKPHQPLEVRMMSFHTFCMLLRHISDKKNLSKYFDTPFLNSFIHMCLSNITCCPNQSIQSLTYCVEKFPQSADLFKHQVGEDWINKLFLQNIPAKHIAQLVSTVEHRSSIKSEFTNIEWHVTNIHHLLNLIVEEGDPDFQPLVLDNTMTTMLTNFSKTISEFEEPKRTTALIYKIRFGMSCIDNLINKPAVKASDTFRFNILGILQLFHRFIDIGSKKSMQSLRKELYISYQPVLIQQATVLLSCLIKHIRSLLAPFTLIVNDLFTKFLNKAVGSKNDTTTLAYRNTKSEIYSCLALYLQVLKSAVDRQGFITFLISHILRDINIEESTMKLLNTNKKGRPIPMKSQNTPEGDLAVKALTALRWIILTTGPRINAKFLNDIQVSLLQCIETALLQQFPHQMTSKRRKEQYHCLMALGTVRHAYYSPPVATIMSLLNRASLEDSDLEVSSYCQEAMSSFEFVAIACRSVMFQTVSTQPQSETVKISSSRPSMWMLENLPESEPRETSFNNFPLQTEFGGTQQKQTNVNPAVSSESLAYLPAISLSQTNTDSFKKNISFDEGASSSQVSTSVPPIAAPSEVIRMDPVSSRIGEPMDDVVSEPPSESNSAEPINSDSDIQFVECGEDSAEEENSAEEASEETNDMMQVDSMLKAFVEAPPDSD